MCNEIMRASGIMRATIYVKQKLQCHLYMSYSTFTNRCIRFDFLLNCSMILILN